MHTTQRKTLTTQQYPKNPLFFSKNTSEVPSDTSKSLVGGASSKNFQKYQVIVQSQQFQSQLKHIEWRSKTELPIVKVLFYKILQKKLLSQCSVVQVAIQNFPMSLCTLPKMMLSQVIYLLKESLIGFERLYYWFGPFDATNKMVLVNKNQKCRVWINENITLNFPGRRAKCSENQFLLKVVQLFQEKCIKTSLSMDMFAGLAKMGRISDAVQFVQAFAKNHRIIVPNKLTFFNEPVQKKQPENVLEENFKAKKDNFQCSTFRKIPKFLLHLRDQKKPEKDVDSKSIDDHKKKRKGSFLNIARNTITPNKLKTSFSGERPIASPRSHINPKSPRQNIKQFWKQAFPKDQNHHSAKTLFKSIPLLRMENQTSLEERVEQKPVNLTIEVKKPQRVTCLRQIDLDLQRQFFKILSNEPTIKDECSVNSSQQTATTINQCQTPPHSSTSLGDQLSVFEKNGWMKRVSNLTESDSLHKSHHEGDEHFSDAYARKDQNLNLLGTMGKQVRQSIMQFS